jgi:hypothetical protein
MNGSNLREADRRGAWLTAVAIVAASVGASTRSLMAEPSWPRVQAATPPVRRAAVVRHVVRITVEGLATADRLTVTPTDSRIRIVGPSCFRGVPAGGEVLIPIDVPLQVADWELEVVLNMGKATSRRRVRVDSGGRS